MVRLYVLGELRLEVDGEPVELPVSRKARLLLAMLALERRAHGRGELAGRLWPDVREDSARASLRNALAQLRGAFGVHAASVVTTAGGETITLAPNVVTDLGELDGLFRAGRAEEAADACVAQLLSGFDDDWTYAQRDALAARVGESLAAEAMAAEAAGDLEASIRLTRRVTALDPLAEIPQRDLMRRAWRRAAIGRGLWGAYERWRERLGSELGIAPSPATRALAANIRTEGGSTAAVPPPVGPSAVRYARTGDRSIAYQRFAAGASELLIVPGWASNLDAVWDFPPLGPMFVGLMFARLGEVAQCTVFDHIPRGLLEFCADPTLPSHWPELRP